MASVAQKEEFITEHHQRANDECPANTMQVSSKWWLQQVHEVETWLF